MAKIKRSCSLLFMLLIGLCSFATIATSPQRDKLAQTYTSQIGVTELTGHNDGLQVEIYQMVTHNHKGDAWCASFVAWCFQKTGIQVHGNGMAASWFRSPYLVYKQSTNGIRQFKKLAAFRGNTGSIYFTRLHRIGHIFFIDDMRDDYVVTVEGNTNNGLSRDGTGVFRNKRRIRNIYSVSNHIG